MPSFKEYSAVRQVTSTIWALVSDGKAACAFRYTKNEMVLASRLVWENLSTDKTPACEMNPQPSSSQFSIRVEGFNEARNVIHMTFEKRNESIERFASDISAKLQRGLENGSFDHLVIVAPRDLSRALNGSLDDRLRGRLLANMPQGYVYDKKGALFVARRKTPSGAGIVNRVPLSAQGPTLSQAEWG
jgi:protein required for attachment to host cells